MLNISVILLLMVNQIKMKKKNYLSKMDDKLLTKILKPVMVQACWIKIVTTLLATKIQRIGLLTQRRYFLKRGGTSNGRQIYNSEYGLQCLELYRSRFITSARAVVPGGSFESFIFFLLSSVVRRTIIYHWKAEMIAIARIGGLCCWFIRLYVEYQFENGLC